MKDVPVHDALQEQMEYHVEYILTLLHEEEEKSQQQETREDKQTQDDKPNQIQDNTLTQIPIPIPTCFFLSVQEGGILDLNGDVASKQFQRLNHYLQDQGVPTLSLLQFRMCVLFAIHHHPWTNMNQLLSFDPNCLFETNHMEELANICSLFC